MAEQLNPTSTTFAGDSNPNSQRNVAWGGIALFVLLAPVAVITALIIYFLFSVVRISHRVLGGFVLLYGLALVVTGQIKNVFDLYVQSFLQVLEGIGESDMTSLILFAIVQQAPFSLLVGGLLGFVVSWWRFKRRPVWVDTKFRKTPYQLFHQRKNIRDIKTDRNSPPQGRTLGINEDGERINQTEVEASAHTLFLGGAGTGKTTTLLIGARDIIRRGESLVFVDMKGSADVPKILAEYAERYGRPFYHWTSHNPRTTYTGPCDLGPCFYDPIGRGDSTRKTNLIMAGRNWTEDYYKLIIQNYLQMAFEIADGAPHEDKNMDSISEAFELLDPQVLKKRSLKLVGDPTYNHIIQEINHLTDKKLDQQTVSTLGSMKSQLGVLRNSIQGPWLKKDPEGKRDINFFEASKKGHVIVFSVDSANYEDNARILGDLIIQDLKTVSGELMADPSRYPLNVFIDEFSAIGSDNIANLLARCREAKIPVSLSTQSLGDLREVSEAFLDKLTGIVSSFVVHRTNSLKDAEIYSGFGGKEKKYVHTQSVEMRTGLFGGMGIGASTGKGNIEQVEDYVISPSDIQNLPQGEMFFIAKSTPRNERVKVIKEERMQVSDKNDHATKAEDLNWKPTEEEHVLSFDKDDIEKYTVDPTINQPLIDRKNKEWNPNAEVEAKPTNPDALDRIFKKENLTKEEAPVGEPKTPKALSAPPVLRPKNESNVLNMGEIKDKPATSRQVSAPPLPSATRTRPSTPLPTKNQGSAPSLTPKPAERPTPRPTRANGGAAPSLSELKPRPIKRETTNFTPSKPAGRPASKEPAKSPSSEDSKKPTFEEW